MLGLGGLISQLIEDARDLVRAEIKLLKSKAFDLLHRSRNAIILLAGALCLIFASLVALMLGFVLALARLVGPAWSGLIVFAVGTLLAGLLGWLAARSLTAGKATDPKEPA
jgi:hypothetical protein